MPENYFEAIAQRVAEIAAKTARTVNPVSIGTVLSVNPDGSVNVDDGMGGCARVANVTNQLVQCGQSVVLGLEPQIGTTTNLCQVQFTINSSSKGCPIETRIDEVEVEPAMPMIFSDDDGNLYDENGDLISAGTGDPAAIDGAFGYSQDFNPVADNCFVGASPTYNVLAIGRLDDAPDYWGNQGEVYSSQATVLAKGLLGSTDRLLGVEVENTDGSHEGIWRLVLRNASDYAIIADPGQAAFIEDWMTAHPTSFYSEPDTGFSVHVSPDPIDGHFWVNVGSAIPPEKMGMFKVSSVDASLIQTVELAVPDQFLSRAKRIS